MRRKFVECLVVADYDLARATAVVDRLGDPRLVAARLDATDEAAVRDALAAHGATVGPLECVNVEHEEVLLMPRWVDVRERVTFKYGLGSSVIATLRTLHELGLSSTEPVRVGDVWVSPREVVATCLPDPATLGATMTGRTCAGLWVRGLGRDGAPRAVYLYHVVDNAWSMREYGCQAVPWQTAINPVVALELLATGAWTGTGVLGPEALPPGPFLDLLTGYGSPWGMQEK